MNEFSEFEPHTRIAVVLVKYIHEAKNQLKPHTNKVELDKWA